MRTSGAFLHRKRFGSHSSGTLAHIEQYRNVGCLNKSMPDRSFDFRGTTMTVLVATEDTGAYAVIEMRHPPRVGPALHVHPRGAEVFLIQSGAYTFIRGTDTLEAHAGDTVVIPTGTPHRYVSGPAGGSAIVITPPGLEAYFRDIAHRLATAPVSIEREFAIAAEFGQEFLESSGHWGGQPSGHTDL
jgi:mannose-6-phosphate isomerase-like protein (cupin superfamily)